MQHPFVGVKLHVKVGVKPLVAAHKGRKRIHLTPAHIKLLAPFKVEKRGVATDIAVGKPKAAAGKAEHCGNYRRQAEIY